MDKESRACLVLALAQGIRATDIWALLRNGMSLAEAVASPESIVKAEDGHKTASRWANLKPQIARLEDRADDILNWCSQHQVDCITCLDTAYPALLREITVPPPILFVRGESSWLSMPQVAVVGSRNATPQGIRNAENFSRHLAAGGFVVTSGLALGIDGAAHRGALQSGKTLAVLGAGVDVIYPRQHAEIYNKIIEGGGAVISEFLPGSSPLPSHFPRRNRLISGLSSGVLVVEAALKSGSLITARYALEQNREVFAIPGSIHSPLSRGNHLLIRQGATLVESAQEIVGQLGGMLDYYAETATPSGPEGTDEEQELLSLMGFDPVDVDSLVLSTGLPAKNVMQMLMLLELDGKVVSINGLFQRLE